MDTPIASNGHGTSEAQPPEPTVIIESPKPLQDARQIAWGQHYGLHMQPVHEDREWIRSGFIHPECEARASFEALERQAQRIFGGEEPVNAPQAEPPKVVMSYRPVERNYTANETSARNQRQQAHDCLVMAKELAQAERDRQQVMSNFERRAEDPVVRPGYYGGEENPFEPVKIMDHYQGVVSYHVLTALAYMLRPHKGDHLNDLKKAVWWLNRRIKQLEAGGK